MYAKMKEDTATMLRPGRRHRDCRRVPVDDREPSRRGVDIVRTQIDA